LIVSRNSFLGALRTKTSLSTAVRETAICRVAVLNKAWYEWESHSPILATGEGESMFYPCSRNTMFRDKSSSQHQRKLDSMLCDC
jgi:phosphoribosyl-AMP cyclohydrolase